MDLGVALYAQVESPPALGWGTKRWDLPGSGEIALIEGSTCPQLVQGSPERSSISAGEATFDLAENEPGTAMISFGERGNSSLHRLGKRAASYGAPFCMPLQNHFCPDPSSDTTGSGIDCEEIHRGWDVNPISKGDVGLSLRDVDTLDKRARDRKPPMQFCSGSAVMSITAPIHDTSSTLLNVRTSYLLLG